MSFSRLALLFSISSLAAAVTAAALPTAVEMHAEKIFNGVSPEARTWIVNEARMVAAQAHPDADAIRHAATERFGDKIKLTQDQQNELALAVLNQVMKLKQEQIQRIAARSRAAPLAAAGTSNPNTGNQKAPAKQGPQNPPTDKLGNTKLDNTQSSTGEIQRELDNSANKMSNQDKLGNAEIQTLMSNYNEAQTLASQIEKNIQNTSHSIIGKI